MAALFSAGMPSSARAGESSSGQRNLIEFKAGKMELKGKRVVADKRKGMFYIHRERESLLTHVCWKDRNTGNVEDDLIVFPDDCKWTKVTQCTTGRVFLLQFTNSSKKLFFWMQEPKDTKDDEYSEKINKILNEPDDPTNGSDLMNNISGSSTEQLLSHVFGNSAPGSSQEQMLQQLFQSGALSSRLGSARAAGGGGGAAGLTTATPTTTEARSNSGKPSESSTARSALDSSRPVSNLAPAPMQLADFQNFMSSLSAGGQSTNSASSSQLDLATALPLDLSTLLSSDEIISRLTPHVPQEPTDLIPNTTTELRQSLNSPQFRQALSLFSTAFSSGQLGPIISQFNLGADAATAANKGDMKAFFEALNKAAKKEPQGATDGKGSVGDNKGQDSNNESSSNKECNKKDGDDEDDKKMDTS